MMEILSLMAAGNLGSSIEVGATYKRDALITSIDYIPKGKIEVGYIPYEQPDTRPYWMQTTEIAYNDFPVYCVRTSDGHFRLFPANKYIAEYVKD
ncbi:hypothetical protein [Oenococcus sicerae]|uniref:Uncharacterized protein n=1 Tax=Oenococcus sicerae TaxID=2203724 RepID=A0AAJ1VPY3_9LACO|nr:hypothetical protein [Oenococcus sicerae]MDN6899542.1 hypothetical protein [Oenococcus sicerae]